MEALAALPKLRLFAAVNRVPQNGVANVGHVYPDLVGAAGFQLAADVGIALIAAHHLPMGDGVPSAPLGDAHLLPVRGVPPDGRVHGAGILLHNAADNGLIGSGHGVVFQLRGQHGVGVIVFRHGQQPRRVLIDAVDDPRAQLAVDAGKVVSQSVEQAVDQCIVGVSGGGMHHQPLGLVDDQQIVVLVDDIQRHFGGNDVHGFCFGDRVLHPVADVQSVVFLTGDAVSRDHALFNESLRRAAA